MLLALSKYWGGRLAEPSAFLFSDFDLDQANEGLVPRAERQVGTGPGLLLVRRRRELCLRFPVSPGGRWDS